MTRLLLTLQIAGWALYVGGALSMELIWRPAQEAIPPSQINVVCQRMGRRYRWIALGALALIAASALGQLARSGEAPALLSLGHPYGRTVLVSALGWGVLVAVVVTLAVVAHPALHVRMDGSASQEERARTRAAVAVAIRRMDHLLRFDLAVALGTALFVASLPWGGLA